MQKFEIIVDPANSVVKEESPDSLQPKRSVIDDRMFVFPKDVPEPDKAPIVRGPNIGVPPANEPFPAAVRGPVSITAGMRGYFSCSVFPKSRLSLKELNSPGSVTGLPSVMRPTMSSARPGPSISPWPHMPTA